MSFSFFDAAAAKIKQEEDAKTVEQWRQELPAAEVILTWNFPFGKYKGDSFGRVVMDRGYFSHLMKWDALSSRTRALLEIVDEAYQAWRTQSES